MNYNIKKNETIKFTDEWGAMILNETIKLMEKALDTTIELGWGWEVYCGERGMDTAIAIQGASLEDITEEHPERKITRGLARLFERSMKQCLKQLYPESKWRVRALFTRDTRDEDTFEINVDIKEFPHEN